MEGARDGWREGVGAGAKGEGLLAASQDAGSCQCLQWERNSAAIKPGFITTRPEMEGEDGDWDGADGGVWRGGGAEGRQEEVATCRGGG